MDRTGLSSQESTEWPGERRAAMGSPSKSYGSMDWTFLSNHWLFVLNRHFSNSILDMFFSGHSWDKRVNRKLNVYF